jgi:hypothetical protein
MINHALTWGVSSTSGSASITGSQTETGATEIIVGPAQFPAGSVNTLLAIAFSATGLQNIILKSDKNMTIKVNSSSSPILTINLIAGQPYQWNVSSGLANPFSAAVTAFYVSCTPAATLTGKILEA